MPSCEQWLLIYRALNFQPNAESLYMRIKYISSIGLGAKPTLLA